MAAPLKKAAAAKCTWFVQAYSSGVDVVIHWHPANKNATDISGALANKSAKFRFYGTASHASMALKRAQPAMPLSRWII